MSLRGVGARNSFIRRPPAKGVNRAPAKGVDRSQAAAPAAPAAPQAPGAGGPPPAAAGPINPLLAQAGDDSATLTSVAGVNAGYESQLAALAQQEGGLMRGMGYALADGPGEGRVYDEASGRYFALDLEGNPFSDAATVKKQFAERKTGQNTQFASMGNVFDGAYGAEQRETQHQEQRSSFDMQQRFLSALGQIGAQRGSALSEALLGIGGARGDQALRNAGTITPGQGNPLPLTPAQRSAKAAHSASTAAASRAAAQAEAAARAKAKKKGKR